MADGWAKIKAASEYAGIGKRTLREWLKQGLTHARLPSGTILIRYGAIDEFLGRFEAAGDQAGKIVDEILKGI
ncbi:MAG: hypothetical protein KAI50_02695 [Desulfobacterales bacterium]|nr:hypothetical protein [Desulfobacterales bacterium]